MDNFGRMFDQVAKEAGISANRAKVAVYLAGLAKDGRTLSDAAVSLRRSPTTVKAFARDFMIDFPDYRPYARERDKGTEYPAPLSKLQFG
jgi:hypothetical protein